MILCIKWKLGKIQGGVRNFPGFHLMHKIFHVVELLNAVGLYSRGSHIGYRHRFRTAGLELKCLGTSFGGQKQKFQSLGTQHGRRVIKTRFTRCWTNFLFEKFHRPFCSHGTVQYLRSVHTELTNWIKVQPLSVVLASVHAQSATLRNPKMASRKRKANDSG